MSKEEADEFAQRKGLIYIETSAKNGTNVAKGFETVTEVVLDCGICRTH